MPAPARRQSVLGSETILKLEGSLLENQEIMDLKIKLNKSYRKAIREFSSPILKTAEKLAEKLADVQVVSLLLQSVIIPGLEVIGRSGAGMSLSATALAAGSFLAAF